MPRYEGPCPVRNDPPKNQGTELLDGTKVTEYGLENNSTVFLNPKPTKVPRLNATYIATFYGLDATHIATYMHHTYATHVPHACTIPAAQPCHAAPYPT